MREGEDDAVDLALLHALEQLVRVPELDAHQLVALLEGLVVDDAEQPDAVLGMHQVLPRDQLADMAAADHDGVLDVRGTAAHDAARHRAADGDEQDREAPEKRRLLQVGVRDAGHPRSGKEDPHAHGDQVEDADDVVGRRVIRPFLVAVVEAVELGRDHPRRQADHEEDEQLGDVRVDLVEDMAERDLRHEEGSDQPDEVRTEQRPADEPPAAPPARCRGARRRRGHAQACDGALLRAVHASTIGARRVRGQASFEVVLSL